MPKITMRFTVWQTNSSTNFVLTLPKGTTLKDFMGKCSVTLPENKVVLIDLEKELPDIVSTLEDKILFTCQLENYYRFQNVLQCLKLQFGEDCKLYLEVSKENFYAYRGNEDALRPIDSFLFNPEITIYTESDK